MRNRFSGRALRRLAGSLSRPHARPRPAALAIACGVALSVAALLVNLGGPSGARSLSLRVLGSPPAPLTTTRSAVSTSSPPVEVSIPAIAVRSRLDGLHLKGDGSLQVPSDAGRVGWYSDGPAPGDDGAAVFAGHLDSLTAPAVFWRLAGLLPGDRIYVTRADGRTLTFVVDHSAVYPRTDLPVTAAYGAVGPELHLITCDGTWDSQARRYSQSLLVVAKLAAAESPPPPASTPAVPPFVPLDVLGHAPTAHPASGSAGHGSSKVSAHPLASSPSPGQTPVPSSPPTATAAPSPTPMPDPPPTIIPSPSPAGTSPTQLSRHP